MTTTTDPSSTLGELTIDGDRLWDSLAALGGIGAYEDVATGLVGVRRLALTDADRDGRDLVVGWFRDAGLEVRQDAIGNVFARRAGSEPDLAPVMIGSHLDSVATAGRFDGCLGVLGGLEVVRTLDDAGISTRRPIEVCFFTEEEGARFGTDMLGSAVAAGRIDLTDAYALTDRDGASIGEELVRLGQVGAGPVPMPRPPHAYLECHIEQGPILADHDRQVGVVLGVQAINWWEITISGRAAHAGTTPRGLRRNASLAAALITVHADEMAASGDYGRLLTTVGRFEVRPNLVNIVPALALLTVDLRNPDADALDRARTDLRACADSIAERTGTTITVRETAHTAPVDFSPTMIDLVEATADRLGLSHERITSGAGHDAGEIAAIAPAGMIFVPGLYEGISHNPREYSTPEACADGINVLLHCVLACAEQ